MRVRFMTAFLVSFMVLGAGGAHAAGSDTTTELTPAQVRAQLANAEGLIRQENYRDAIEVLNGVVESSPREADAYNLLGFSYRKSKDFNRAERNYKRALRLNPEHKGAIEYYGELLIQTDRRGKAEDMLAKLETLCPSGCAELDQLKKALAGQQTSNSAWPSDGS